jgi:hypothetical protein
VFQQDALATQLFGDGPDKSHYGLFPRSTHRSQGMIIQF